MYITGLKSFDMNSCTNRPLILLWLMIFTGILVTSCMESQDREKTNIVTIAEGFAETHVNAVIFRRNSISSYNGHQYVAFYDNSAYVILAKRKLGTNEWKIHQTQYKGNVGDAHNSISIMHDGDGYLHMSWDHHNDSLRYAVSRSPESTEMGPKMAMVGDTENRVTYPEFYALDNGDLVFVYRDGSSGNGNLVMNHYDPKSKTWKRVQSNLIDGEGERNAYWQMYIDNSGVIHVSWVWRETGDVATNHDICYARSRNNGISWETSTGEPYILPINQGNAEYVLKIPQNSNLINTTSITADQSGNPYIATYFKAEEDQVTQFKVLYKSDGNWKSSTVSNRKSDFVLGGRGTRSVPISRPQIVVQQKENEEVIHVIYRDEEYDNKVCIASTKISGNLDWRINTLGEEAMSRWEPTYDTELWENQQLLHLYYQVTHQGSGETPVSSSPTMVSVMEIFLD